MNFLFFIVFFLFVTSHLYAQTLKGSVSDSLGKPIYANILIKKNETTNSVLQYTFTNEKGAFNLTINQPVDSLTIEVSSYGYISQFKSINLSKNRKKKYSFDFILKEKFDQLNEVVLKANKRIEVKNDTTTYNPQAFKDGTEKTVEDLLKKLPGIEVKSNGEVKFKGKSIKKFMLDGDDLFGTNYTLGTRNIDVNLIDKVQGLDNFEEKALLKGLQDSDDVALNIILKKRKTDVSLNNSLAYGIENRWYQHSSGLLVSKKVKAFSAISYNNIGSNSSAYNLNSELLVNTINREQIEAKSILSEGNFSSILDDSFHSLNNLFFNSNNAIFKLLEQSSLKVNLGIYTNELNRTNTSFTEVNDGTSIITFNNTEHLTKSPKIVSGQVLFSNKEQDSLHWEYQGLINFKNTTYTNESTNNTTFQLGKLNSEFMTTFHNFNVISRLDKNNAFEGVLLYSFSKSPQELRIRPATHFNGVALESQNSEFQKTSFRSKIGFIGKAKWLKYNLSSGFNYVYSKLNSTLTSTQNLITPHLNNDMNYIIQSFYLFPKASVGFNKGSLKLGINLQYNTLTYEDDINAITRNETDLIFNSDVSFNYNLSRKSSVNIAYSHNQFLPQEDQLYSNIIQTNFRSFSTNIIDLRYIKSDQISSKFRYYDFYKRTTISLECKYLINEGNYFNRTLISEDISINSTFFNPAVNRSYSIHLSYESYFHFIRSTLKFDTLYTVLLDKNIVNNSDLRDLKNKNIQFIFTIRTGFKSKINFENISNFETNRFESNGLTNNRFSIQNQFKSIYKISESLYSNTIFSYISPDTSITNNYTFLDTELSYRPINKNYQIGLTCKNLTNNKHFETVYVNDFSRSVSSYNLIERYIMLSLNMSF